MSSDYYNVLTNIGSAKITEMLTTQQKLQNLTIAFGDGGGSVPTPSKTRTTLINEVHRRPADKFYRHPTLTNNIVVEVTIPSNIGGFWIREFGIFFENAMICHGSLAPSYKEASTDGFSTYRLKPYLNIGTDQIDVLEISGDLVTATESWTDEFYVPRDEIVDNLITDDAEKPVSAKQAKYLNDNKLGKAETAVAASKLETSRQVSFSGAATGSFNFDGSTGTSCTLTLANSGATAGTYGSTLKIPVITVNAKGLITTVTTQDIPSASTSVKGLVQLNNTLTSTSTVQAATAAQVKALNDGKLDKSGGTVSGDMKFSAGAIFVNLGAANTNAIRTRGIQGIKTDNSAPDGLYVNPEGGPTYFGLNQYSIGDDGEFSGNAATATTATNCSRSVIAGNGLSGGGALSENRTLTLGTPGTITPTSANAVTNTSHTHSLDVDALPNLGSGQTWQNVKTSRAVNTTYTNSTGKPIIVNIAWAYQGGGDNYAKFLVNGISIARGYGEPDDGVSVVIPAGSTYRYNSLGWVITEWREYR